MLILVIGIATIVLLLSILCIIWTVRQCIKGEERDESRREKDEERSLVDEDEESSAQKTEPSSFGFRPQALAWSVGDTITDDKNRKSAKKEKLRCGYIVSRPFSMQDSPVSDSDSESQGP